MTKIKLTSGNFKAVPNQKAFRVNKRTEAQNRTDARVSDLFVQDIFEASRELKDTTFKVYMYLASNQRDYVGGLSMAEVIKQTGVSESSYRRAIKELIEKSYLVYNEIWAEDAHGNSLPLYDFYARPNLYSN